MIQTLQGSAFPFTYAIPDSLLKSSHPLPMTRRWLDKPDVNNPDEYLNQCLEMCENYNRAYQQRRDATHVPFPFPFHLVSDSKTRNRFS